LIHISTSSNHSQVHQMFHASSHIYLLFDRLLTVSFSLEIDQSTISDVSYYFLSSIARTKRCRLKLLNVLSGMKSTQFGV